MPDELTPNSENFPKTQDELNKIIQNALAPKLNKINALESEKAQISQERDSLTQQVTERDQKVANLESTVGERDRTLLVTEVAHAKKVPAKYLTGDSKEALEASADEFLADVQSLGGSQNSGSESQHAEGAGSGQQQGHVPSAGTGGEKPPRPTYDELKQKAYEDAKKQKGALL